MSGSKHTVYENGQASKEISTRDGANGSTVTHVQSIHQGSLGATFKTVDAVITEHKNGDVSIDRRK